jgi:hypothetical protein
MILLQRNTEILSQDDHKKVNAIKQPIDYVVAFSSHFWPLLEPFLQYWITYSSQSEILSVHTGTRVIISSLYKCYGSGMFILDPGSRIQDPGSRIQDPGSRIQDPNLRSRIQDLGSTI